MQASVFANRKVSVGSIEIIALLEILDLATTFVILGLGGMEVNPVSAGLMARFGMAGWVVFKLVLASAFVAMVPQVWNAGRAEHRAVVLASAPFAALMLGVVVNNIIQLAIHLD